MTRRTPHQCAAAPGFTILELLVAISIIAVLAGLSVTAGSAVLRRQRVTLTENLLRTLDRALEEYVTEHGAIPKYIVLDGEAVQYDEVPGSDNDLESDPYNGIKHSRRPDAAVFIKQANAVQGGKGIINDLPEQFLVITSTDDDPDITPSIVDPWGDASSWPVSSAGEQYPVARQQLIYYVHPDNDLAQALYGRCVNRRPYFFSAGPDQHYGLTAEFGSSVDAIERATKALKDNIYSYPVDPPILTTNFNSMHR